ncbi:hypothetical protein [Clostridium butyricum]
MEEIKWTTIVITIITSIIALINNKQDKGDKLQEEYFKDILLEYFRVKNINPKIDIYEFLNRYKFKKICIPSYIFYLSDLTNERIVKDLDNEKVLEQIMIVDYWTNYPNVKNYMSRIVYNLLNTVYFILGIIFSVFILVATYCIAFYAVICAQNIIHDLSIGEDINLSIILSKNIWILIYSVLLLVGSVLLNQSRKISLEYLNIYTSNKKSIRSIIKNKVRMYRKMTKKNYFPIKGTSER